ncbi:MAG TPA: baseplate J/gp47 family protein [Mesotoga sp.]|nr:baseplate J/gp47 family protein [Mesotoga sp.]
MRTYSEIFSQITDRIMKYTPVKTLQPGTVLRTLVEAMSKELERVNYELDRALYNNVISTASGMHLDAMAKVFGLERRIGYDVNTVSGIEFYSPSGVLGEEITGEFFRGDIKITNADNSVELSVVPFTVSSNDLNRKSINAMARVTRKWIDEIPAGTLKFYTPTSGKMKVNNPNSIRLSVGGEGDEEFRYKVSRFIRAVAGGNRASVRVAAISVPGVADVMIDDRSRYGFGAFDVYVIGEDLTTDYLLVTPVEEAIMGITPPGIKANVMATPKILVGCSFKAIVRNGSSDEMLREIINKALKNYVDNITISGELSKYKMIDAIAKSDINVIDVEDFRFFVSFIDPNRNITQTGTTEVLSQKVSFGGIYKFMMNPTGGTSIEFIKG